MDKLSIKDVAIILLVLALIIGIVCHYQLVEESYSNGYNKGLKEAQETFTPEPTTIVKENIVHYDSGNYDIGYEDGYDKGREEGYQLGYQAGYDDGYMTDRD